MSIYKERQARVQEAIKKGQWKMHTPIGMTPGVAKAYAEKKADSEPHNNHEAAMTNPTRAAKLAQELQQRRPELAAKGIVPVAREVKQADTAGMDKLAKRRAALKKLHDFKDGVL